MRLGRVWLDNGRGIDGCWFRALHIHAVPVLQKYATAVDGQRDYLPVMFLGAHNVYIYRLS